MLYLDTFGATGGLGRCTIELLPALAERLGKIVLAGRSHVVDSYSGQLPAGGMLQFWNLEKPRFAPGALAVRFMDKVFPDSSRSTEMLLNRAGVGSRNAQPVLINHPPAWSPPRRQYQFDTFIHDLNWRHFPGNVSDPQAIDDRCAEWVRRSRRVFTNSDFTRREILEAYNVDAGKVISAPLAPPSVPFTGSAPEGKFLSRFGLKPNGYFFYPAAQGTHKGHDVLADALAESEAATLPLVITTPFDPNSDPQTVNGKLLALQRAGKLISLPHLPWRDLMQVAAGSRAYVLPSRFEGFGFPLVEAMSIGKPAICSDIPAFQEILARYGSRIQATTFPAGDSAALRDLTIAASRDEISWEGSAGSKAGTAPNWSWADTAKAVADGLSS